MAKILVVDDDPDFCEITRLILARAGYEVETAANGDEAMQAIHRDPPDLLVLDVMMAGMLDGLQVAHKISQDAELRGLPVIMVSSITNTPNAAYFPTDEYLPIDAWITKPVDPDDLLKKINRLAPTSHAAAV